MMLVMLCAVSHLVLDSADGTGLMLFYPLSSDVSVLSPALGIKGPAIAMMSSAEVVISAFIACVLTAKVYLQWSHERLARSMFERTGLVDTIWRAVPSRDASAWIGGARTRVTGS